MIKMALKEEISSSLKKIFLFKKKTALGVLAGFMLADFHRSPRFNVNSLNKYYNFIRPNFKRTF